MAVAAAVRRVRPREILAAKADQPGLLKSQAVAAANISLSSCPVIEPIFFVICSLSIVYSGIIEVPMYYNW